MQEARNWINENQNQTGMVTSHVFTLGAWFNNKFSQQNDNDETTPFMMNQENEKAKINVYRSRRKIPRNKHNSASREQFPELTTKHVENPTEEHQKEVSPTLRYI
uniref:Uncharacterized protein n=1 Tax=Bracon brevicornis TaxID=1563983 RepID=A0A6V7KBS7_9HYME